MPLHRGGGEGGESANPPSSESSKPPPPSPQKKRKKVARSQSIPAQINNAVPPNPGFGLPHKAGFNPPPNETMGYPCYDDHMHGAPPMHHGHTMMPGGPPHMQGGLPPHMMPHPHPPSPHSPLNSGGQMMGHPQAAGMRYMRQSSVPMPPPQHMYPQAVSPQMAGMMTHSPAPHPAQHSMAPPYSPGMPPNMAPMNGVPMNGGPLGGVHSDGMPPGGVSPGRMGHSQPGMPPGVPSSVSPAGAPGPPNAPGMANPAYPGEESAPFPQGSHPPPLVPLFSCGTCHKEITETDEALLCELGCNIWFHRQCTCMTEAAYQYISKEPAASWACDSCFDNKRVPMIYTRSRC
ncbi:hypothetical protein EB796_011814 [Bugula neritina]|uniref:PHD-type domain-containing protein n=1 Tax=Bugula neritina TaxID=10212 RepID=A0A7J7JV79_BUGNE|nr:hypothetical protein EB796_011814 [Bugula neritina]